MTSHALNLASWIRARRPYGLPLSHLKLQKLAFFAYGAALAFDHELDVGDVRFEAWKHGPVSREIYDAYRAYGAAAIPPEISDVRYSPEAESVLGDALLVYGCLDAWSLREQSHLEEPWIRAGRDTLIERETIRLHFANKFRRSRVQYPEFVTDGGSSRLDGIPLSGFSSLHELALVISTAYR